MFSSGRSQTDNIMLKVALVGVPLGFFAKNLLLHTFITTANEYLNNDRELIIEKHICIYYMVLSANRQ